MDGHPGIVAQSDGVHWGDARAFKALVKAAVARNGMSTKKL